MEDSLSLELQNKVVEYLSAYGIDCSPTQAELLVKHLDLVIEKNKVMNLTRILEPREGIVLHVVDSCMPLAFLKPRMSSQSVFLDLGTGGGFPGVPLSVMTGAQGVLLDSVGKKVNAVNEFLGELGLSNSEAVHARVEELALEHRGEFDYVFARAVAQTNVLIEYATPLLKKGGKLVVQKANPTDDEIHHANKAAVICGLKNVSRETFELPNELGHREIMIFEKVTKAKVKLPRRVGEAKSKPLGE